MIKVDLYTSNVCSRCIRAKDQLSHIIKKLGAEKFDLNHIDVVERIDDAIALGILAAPSIVINNQLVFSTMPTDIE